MDVVGDVVINACDELAENEIAATNNSTDCRVVNLIYKLSTPSPILFSNRSYPSSNSELAPTCGLT